MQLQENSERKEKYMKMKQMVTFAASILLMAGAARAAHVWEDPSAWWGGHWVYETTDKYTPNELSFDMFGSYVHPEHHLSNLFDTNIRHNGFWGGCVGL